MESPSRPTPRRWPVAVLRLVVLGTATVFAVLATILGGIAQDRVPGDARWTSIATSPEFWIALISGLVAAGLVASSGGVVRWLGAVVQDTSVRDRDRALVRAYLRARISAWDTPEWGIEVPSTVERRLTVTDVADREGRQGSEPRTLTETEPRTLTEEAALDGRDVLVVLGGPGTGKTWLARRYARRVAEEALRSLDGGADLSEIELPVYTTWDHWARSADTDGEGVRAGLVASSFGADVHHGGGETAQTVAVLREILNQDRTRVLFVVDSLDEATGKDHAVRLGNLTGLAGHGARVVITSRHGAWDRVRNRMPERTGSHLVVELRDLSYPEDVEAFVGAWFERDAERAAALTDQLRTRHDVARAAGVPLILTFYCLVAADGDPSAPLPARRHDLYDRIIAQSLARANRSVGADPDHRYVERVARLRAWAWQAVGTSNTPAGLGDWGETFVPGSPPTAEDQHALDGLAPRVGVARERTVRRFQHRTLLEHLVAEHVATLDADEAADVLVPHLWFDPDWGVAAPAALAAHNRAHPGALLDRVLRVMDPLDPGPDPARQVARWELARLVLRAAADSEPEEWRPEHRELVGALRIESLGRDPRLAARLAHWPAPPGLVGEAIEQIRAGDDGYVATDLAEALAAQARSAWDRARILAAVLERVSRPGDSYQAGNLARTLPGLVDSADDRERAVTVVLERIAAAAADRDDQVGVGRLAEALPELVTGERGRALTAVLDLTVTTESSFVAGELAGALPGLIATAQERERVVVAVLERIDSAAGASTAGELVEALPGLVVGPQERERAITVVLRRMATEGDGYDAVHLVRALQGLAVSERDRERVLAVALDRLAGIENELSAGELAKALPGLAGSAEDRGRIFDAVLVRIAERSSSRWWSPSGLSEALPALVTSDEDRARAVAALLDVLTTEPGVSVGAGAVAGALAALEPSEADRDRALSVLLDQLTAARAGFLAEELAEGLPDLVTDGYRVRVTSAILDRIAGTEQVFSAVRLVEAFLRLGPPERDRERALALVLDRLAEAEPGDHAGYLAETLPSLVVSDRDRGRAFTAMLGQIAADEDGAAISLAEEGLPPLAVSDDDRERAVLVVLDQLAMNDGARAELLAYAVRDLVRPAPDAGDLLRRHTILAGRPLPAPLVSHSRALLACADWLSLVRGVPEP